MRTVLIVTQPSRKPIVYGSVMALLDDPANPVEITPQWFRKLQKQGYPIEHSGCRIDQAEFVSSGDARGRALDEKYRDPDEIEEERVERLAQREADTETECADEDDNETIYF